MKSIDKKWLNSLSEYRLELMIESHQKTIDENLIHDELKTFFLSEIKVVKAILKKRGADEIEKIFDGPRGRIDDFMAKSEDDQYMDTGAAYELLIDLRDSIDAFHKQFDALFSTINPAQDKDEN